MAFFARAGSILRNATNRKISSEIRSFPSVFQAMRCFSSSPSTKLFVGGVSYSTDEQSLREVFSRHGEVIDARIIMDRETGRSKGFGFITFSTVEEASSAIQALDGQELHGRRVGVNFANERPRGFGGGGGGFDGSYGNTSYGGGYQGGYGNTPYSAPSGGGGYGDSSGGYGGNVSVGYGGGNNANYSGGETNPVNYGSTPDIGGYGGGNNVNCGAAVGGGETNTVNYGTAPVDGGYGGGPNNGFASNQYPGSSTGYGNANAGTGSSFAGGYDRTGGLGYGENGQENFSNDDHEVGAFDKRANEISENIRFSKLGGGLVPIICML